MKEINKGDIWMTKLGIVEVTKYEFVEQRWSGEKFHYCRYSGNLGSGWISEPLFMYKISK